MYNIQTYVGNYTSETNLHEKALQVFDLLDVRESSRKDYKARIGLFVDYVSEHKFNNNTFLSFKRYLAERNDLSVSSKAKYLTVSKIFLKELTRQGIIPIDITINIKGFQQTRKHKRFGLTQDEIDILFESIGNLELTPKNLRLITILHLLIYQGLRQIEIIRLDVSDIDTVRKTALIHGKGRDDKELIDLHPKTVDMLKNYINICKVKSGALFVSHSNNNRNGRLTTKSLREIVTGYLKTLEIKNTTHGFRHYFTTKLIRAFSNDLLTVQKFTRHHSVETLQVYNDNITNKENLPKYYEAFNS